MKNKKEHSEEQSYVVLFLWVAYNLQSLVSVPIVPLVLIGFMVSGLVLRQHLHILTEPSKKSVHTITNQNLRNKLENILILILLPLLVTLNVKEMELKKIIDFVPTVTSELSLKQNMIEKQLTANLFFNEHKYLLAKNYFNQGLGNQGKQLMLETLNSNLHKGNKLWYLAYFAKNNEDWETSLSYLKQAVKLDPANLEIRKDYTLMLLDLNQKNNALEQLKIMTDLAPQATQTLDVKSKIN